MFHIVHAPPRVTLCLYKFMEQKPTEERPFGRGVYVLYVNNRVRRQKVEVVFCSAVLLARTAGGPFFGPLLFRLQRRDRPASVLRWDVYVFRDAVCLLVSCVRPRAQDIELGNIPETLPSLSGSSRWSLGSLSLLPTSTAQTSVSVSCISDDAEGESETQVHVSVE